MNIPFVLQDSAECLGIIESSGNNHALLQEQDILKALCSPTWQDNRSTSIFNIIKPRESVCFVVSDHTRKTAVDKVLPVVINELSSKGCAPSDMFILVASGIHRPSKPAEISSIIGENISKLFQNRIFTHNANDNENLVAVGITSRGHQVRVHRRAIEADRLVLTGTVGYHYHAGFGGGRKSLVPGLASRDTIAHNHSLTLDPSIDRIHPKVDIGILDNNPVSEEMLEGARMCNPDIIINTVLKPNGGLIGVFSGDLDLAHRKACELVEDVLRVEISQTADIVLASAGSALNWIQSHKALVNAHRAIHRGGIVILTAPCPEGLGDERFRYWVKKESISEIYAELRKSAEVLGQTALSSKLRGADAVLVTDMTGRDISDLGIRTAKDVESAVVFALSKIEKATGSKPTYYIMPEARHSVPFILHKQA